MENKITKKIIASLMLTTFALANTLSVTLAVEGIEEKPLLRSTEAESSIRLKGDVSFIKTEAPITLSLRDSDVKQVLRMFADKAGMNIVFHESVAGKVTLDLVDVPLNNAFDMVMEINNLNYVVENDRTIVVAKAGTSGFNFSKQDMTLLPVKYVSATAMADFLNKNIFAIQKPGLSDSDIVTTTPTTNELIIFGTKNDVNMAKKIVDKFDKKPTTTTFKVNHTTPAEMANMICSMLLPATGGGSTGGAAGIVTGAAASGGGGGGGALTLNAGEIACTLDGQANGSMASLPLQNLSIAYYTQLGTINVVGGSEQQLEMIKDFINMTDKKQPQAYLEVSIVELSEDGSKELTNTWQIMTRNFSAKFDGTSTSTDPLYPVFFKGDGFETMNPESYPYEPNGQLSKWGQRSNIVYTINYLIKNGKARVVVNPKIIITNGEESTIEVTQDYLESVEIDSSTSTGGTVITRDYNVEEDQGVTLSITPFISPDGYVTMNITPEYSTEIGEVLGSESIAGTAQTYKAATLLSHRNMDLKNVRIKDGETLVIAGMIQEKESKTINKIPVLGDLPLIGALFRSTSNAKSKSEMVIMLTPKIITDTEDAIGHTDTL